MWFYKYNLHEKIAINEGIDFKILKYNRSIKNHHLKKKRKKKKSQLAHKNLKKEPQLPKVEEAGWKKNNMLMTCSRQ